MISEDDELRPPESGHKRTECLLLWEEEGGERKVSSAGWREKSYVIWIGEKRGKGCGEKEGRSGARGGKGRCVGPRAESSGSASRRESVTCKLQYSF